MEHSEIDRAAPEDIEGIAQTYVDSARYHHDLDPDLYQVPDLNAVARDLAYNWEGPDQVTFVARSGREIVGSDDVRLVRPRSPAGKIKPCVVAEVGIAILGPYRRHGVGRRLMEAAERWARSQGAEVMTLDCHAANAAAIEFYKSLGYRTAGLLMRKPLGPIGAEDEPEPNPGDANRGTGPRSGNDFYCQQVLSGRLPVEKVCESGRVLAFHHTRPAYPVHLVVIPKTHIASLVDLSPEGDELLLELLSVVVHVIPKRGDAPFPPVDEVPVTPVEERVQIARKLRDHWQRV